jgi:NADH:ubiquinone oxidoreductase subunit 4 (subunit M)
MLQRVFFGPVKEPHTHAEPGHGPSGDINGRELAAIVPIAVVCVVLGVAPGLVLDAAKPDLRTVAWFADRARDRAATTRGVDQDAGKLAARQREAAEEQP